MRKSGHFSLHALYQSDNEIAAFLEKSLLAVGECIRAMS